MGAEDDRRFYERGVAQRYENQQGQYQLELRHQAQREQERRTQQQADAARQMRQRQLIQEQSNQSARAALERNRIRKNADPGSRSPLGPPITGRAAPIGRSRRIAPTKGDLTERRRISAFVRLYRTTLWAVKSAVKIAIIGVVLLIVWAAFGDNAKPHHQTAQGPNTDNPSRSEAPVHQ